MSHIKRIVALVCFGIFFSTIGKGQSVIVNFAYDWNGNLITKGLRGEDLKKDNSPSEDVAKDTANVFFSALDETEESAFYVYPNPTEEKVTVDCPKEMFGKCNVLLYSPLGVLLEKHIVSKTESFDLSHRPPGVYLLQIIHNEKTLVWRVVKQ